MYKRLTLCLFLVVSLSLSFLFSGCSQETENNQLTTLKFSEVIRSVYYAPHYVAISQGFFVAEGLQVEMSTTEGSDKGAAGLLAKTADISLIGTETLLYLSHQQGINRLQGFYLLTRKDGSILLSRTKIVDFKWADLEGKKILSWRLGSAPTLVLMSLLQQQRIPKVDLITNISPSAMVGAFLQGRGDFIQLYEPLASQLLAQGKAYFAASLGESFGPFPETSYAATTDYIKHHRDVIKKFTRAVKGAIRWINHSSNREISKAIASYFPGVDKKTLSLSVQRYKKQHVWAINPSLTRKQLEILEGLLLKNKLLKRQDKRLKVNVRWQK